MHDQLYVHYMPTKDVPLWYAHILYVSPLCSGFQRVFFTLLCHIPRAYAGLLYIYITDVYRKRCTVVTLTVLNVLVRTIGGYLNVWVTCICVCVIATKGGPRPAAAAPG